jgi:hypothetical protein
MILHISEDEDFTWCGLSARVLPLIDPPATVPGNDRVCILCLQHVGVNADESKKQFDRQREIYYRDSIHKLRLENLKPPL